MGRRQRLKAARNDGGVDIERLWQMSAAVSDK